MEYEEYRKTKRGVVINIHKGQRATSKRRGDPMPNYTSKELIEWVFEKSLFHTLYDNWVRSDYATLLIPTLNRINDYLSYTFDNIELMTWQDNLNKAYYDRRNGINNKVSRSVIGTNIITGDIIEFNSISLASRFIHVNKHNVWACCNNKRKSVCDFIWEYKN